MNHQDVPVTLPLEENVLRDIVQKAKDWGLMHGLAIRPRDNMDSNTLTIAPHVLFPSPIPRKDFEELIRLQPALNLLMHKVAHDHSFLEESLKNTLICDEFTRKLYEIYQTVRNEGFSQEISLGMLRNDVIFSESDGPKQVEINSIASGLAHLGPRSRDAHRFQFPKPAQPELTCLKLSLGGRGHLDLPSAQQSPSCGQQRSIQVDPKDLSLGMFRSDYLPDTVRSLYLQVEFNTIASSFPALSCHVKQLQSYVLSELGYRQLLENMPDNNALNLMCLGIVKAWEQYGNEKAVVIFVVEDVTTNICDQRFMEFEVRRIQPKINVLRVNFSDSDSFKLGSKKELLVNQLEVAVVYYRTGYAPDQYNGDEWDTRLLIERSRAIKCPSIHYHLAGTKKVQQVLASPKILEKFVQDPDEAAAIRRLFTEIYPLDLTAEGDKAYNLALQLPENYVLKPQREGGGNNIYGSDIPNFLMPLGKERQAYILMGLITPRPTQNYLVSKLAGDLPAVSTVVSEFGIYGVILGSCNNIITNYQAGHMLRSKLSTSNEGGVAVGSGFLDSPYLV